MVVNEWFTTLSVATFVQCLHERARASRQCSNSAKPLRISIGVSRLFYFCGGSERCMMTTSSQRPNL